MNKTEKTDFPKFLEAVIEAALFSQPEYETGTTLSPESLETIEAHAKSFWIRTWYYLDAEKGLKVRDIQSLGHDFWFSSQGHGCGFDDGDWETYGELFDALAQKYPVMDLTSV